ncbi:protein disulfide-isomerase precursor [Podospora pseudopauciseta]|uniref:Protein disulfide-isomerase n=3 Tax=Podospora TaxID=5144 RepID=A0ABR0HZ99_9PEZI|nr:protein disulfide-isomerase precursor [Podospora bellae-mahoneyi]KAK4673249.1 protein disulfide-isomerase precursor [Podospora pseudopauciseta]KAK4681752.1 protein disulfide-isomerase precursor [Podospora pseudoanserina]
MQKVHRIALGLLAAAAIATASDVVQLKKDTFDDFVKANDLVLAEFFAPWCGHCKALAPEYEEAATTLKEKNIKLAKIDCTEETELCQQHGVEGYPTLKVFRGLDNVGPYKGQRKAGAITSYMIKQSLPAVSDVTKDTLEEFKKADKVVIVAYVDAADKASSEAFSAVAEKLRDDYPFGVSTDAALAEAEGVKAPAVVVYKDFDEGKSVFTEKFEAEAIQKFAKTAATPLIGEIGPETYSDYMSAGLPLAYIFAETAEERKEISEKLKPIAEAQRGVVNFGTIDAKAYGAHAGNLNLKTDKFPAFAIQETAKNQKFPFDQEKEITLEAIKTFVDDFVAGKVEPSIKSEPIPEKQEGPVTVVVAKSYNDIVLDDTKDVLIEFYAPWCGHCKSLAPKYDELASLYAKSEFKDKVVIAKVDATANDVPDEIQGFPTIKLYPAGAKNEPVTYSGSRTVDDLIKFVAENGKYKASVSEEAEEPSAAPAASEEASSAEPAAETKEAAKEADHDEL